MTGSTSLTARFGLSSHPIRNLLPNDVHRIWGRENLIRVVYREEKNIIGRDTEKNAI
jgi:hypothetical protein